MTEEKYDFGGIRWQEASICSACRAGGTFSVSTPIDGQAATHANGGTIGFAAASTAQVDAFHAAGLAHGGTPCEEPPGWRGEKPGRMYIAYLRDPSGNKICAVYREPKNA